MPKTDDISTPGSPLLTTDGEAWELACSQGAVQATLEQFLEVTDLLLEQVQLNSTHLFRADILHDTSGKLETLAEKEARRQSIARTGERDVHTQAADGDAAARPATASKFEGFELGRTIVRCLIPRKPQLDQPLEQSCFIYYNTLANPDKVQKQALVVYSPHCASSGAMPWYHPKVRGLAYLYTTSSSSIANESSLATLSVHYLPFPDTPSPLPDRLTRTFQSLLNTMVRLLKLPSKSKSLYTSSSSSFTHGTANDIATMDLSARALKDTILPQHTVQNTYTRLKQAYAADLISRWIEKTEPSKHVFEDLSIAAFLIELWSSIYGSKDHFNETAGFVDIACGNGVLVYILFREGWKGWGFDARRRKTWDVFGAEAHDFLHEKVCIPRPFAKSVDSYQGEFENVDIHDGVFADGTFIISNHADELTCWTPILAALSNLKKPLPFLAVPCCSHALDGSRRRYTQKEVAVSLNKKQLEEDHSRNGEDKVHDEQPAKGDLKAMRTARQKANAGGDDKSMYACLTRKTAALAQEIGMDVELTLMRIPSTRNIGIVGNRKKFSRTENGEQQPAADMNGLTLDEDTVKTEIAQRIQALLDREFANTGNVDVSARTWIEKAKKLHGGQGRGKVNLNGAVAGLSQK